MEGRCETERVPNLEANVGTWHDGTGTRRPGVAMFLDQKEEEAKDRDREGYNGEIETIT